MAETEHFEIGEVGDRYRSVGGTTVGDDVDNVEDAEGFLDRVRGANALGRICRPVQPSPATAARMLPLIMSALAKGRLARALRDSVP